MTDLYEGYYTKRRVDTDAEGYYVAPYLLEVLPVSRSSRILDIGCGTGKTLTALKRAGYTELSGLDVSDEAVGACLRKGLNVIKADIRGYAEGPEHGRFDFIIMSHVLEHLPKERVIDELATIRENLLEKGGSLFVAVPNAQSNTGCYWAYEDFTHNTLFTAGSLDFVLRFAGFNKIVFVDPEGTAGVKPFRKLVKKTLLKLYKKNLDFWNRVTSSYYHAPSPRIYTYELKALATRDE